jgi:NTF2 fold immunity protein
MGVTVKICTALFCSLLLLSLVRGQVNPKRAYVPDSETAVKVAEAVLVPVYGKSQVESERPFVAKLKTDVWTVSGTLHCPDAQGGTTTTNCNGGVAVVEISRTDARILSMVHSK